RRCGRRSDRQRGRGSDARSAHASHEDEADELGRERVARDYFIISEVFATTLPPGVSSVMSYLLPLARPSSSLIEMSPVSTPLFGSMPSSCLSAASLPPFVNSILRFFEPVDERNAVYAKYQDVTSSLVCPV